MFTMESFQMNGIRSQEVINKTEKFLIINWIQKCSWNA